MHGSGIDLWGGLRFRILVFRVSETWVACFQVQAEGKAVGVVGKVKPPINGDQKKYGRSSSL